jgi:type VI secretion system protein ImpC
MLEAPVQPAPSDPWASWIKQLVAPYVSPAADPRQAELVRCVDLAIAATMNRLLHHPDFQRLEAAWRSLDWLVRNVETSPTLRLFVLDVSIDELHRCIAAADDPLQSAVAGWLTSSARLPAGVPYALLVSPFSFGGGDPDRQALTALSALAQASSTAIIATATADLVGFQPPDPDLDQPRPVADSWQQLCQVPGSAGVGLIWPRYMVRLPYGPDTSPLERFD